MEEGLLAMSASERERSSLMRALSKRHLRQTEAAERLCLSVRQIKRLLRGWRASGDAGLISRQRGRVSPRRLATSKRARIDDLLRSKYADFGATLAAEKLFELNGIAVSRETVRRIQIDLGLAQRRRRRSGRVHSPRERRPRFGELIQIDGSPHDWFEGRGPRCTLIVFIDDATSRLTALRFAPTETTKDYLGALRAHVLAHGVPLAFYSDRHGIFRVNAKQAQSGDGYTEFGRVAERLRIELIQATTPQAKGAGQPDFAGPTDQGDAAARHLRHCRRASLRRRVHHAVEREIRQAATGRRKRPSAVDERPRGARRSTRASRESTALEGLDVQLRRQGLLHQNHRPGNGAARRTRHAAALSGRGDARRLQEPSLDLHPCQNEPWPRSG